MKRPLDERLYRLLSRPPFRDPAGRKPGLERISRAQPHVARHLRLQLPGWPQFSRPLRIAFLSDFHTGSHSGDVRRLAIIAAEAAAFTPDLVLFGGDFVNMQPFGGGRVPPDVIAGILARIDAPVGRFAILGNHDLTYGAEPILAAFAVHGIVTLRDRKAALRFENHGIEIVGIEDAHAAQASHRALLESARADRPAIILTHDPIWFKDVAGRAHLTLAGHTHGGQVRLPGIGAVFNASKAPLSWSHGLVIEEGRHLYVTSGIGTSGIPLRIGVPPEFVILDVTGP